jgi:hypothetical protein
MWRGGCYFTAPIVKPEIKRSRKKVYRIAAGIHGINAPAMRGPHRKTSPLTSPVGTPTLIVFWADTETNDKA